MNDKSSLRLLLIGCGKMGGALLANWLKSGLLLQNIIIVKPSKTLSYNIDSNIKIVSTIDEVDDKFIPDFVIIAVKPHLIAEILPSYAGYVQSDAIFLSIAAGKNIQFLEDTLNNQNAKVIRSMPNLPVAIGCGTTAIVANKNINHNDLYKTQQLLSMVGSVHNITDESTMDGISAISGSGPAYLFLLIESLTSAGIAVGLDDELAKNLAIETIYGASAMARTHIDEEGQTAQSLRQSVTSKNGMTQAALDVLMNDNALKKLINEAVAAAAQRSLALS